MNWIFENADTLLTIVGLAMALASAIVGLTPTPKDDEFLAWLRSILVRLSILQPKDAPGTFKAPFAGPKK